MLRQISVCFCVIGAIMISLITPSIAEDKSDEGQYTYNYAAATGKCQVYDPFESFNRKVFIVNGVLDTIILRPIAKGYGRFTNYYTKQRVEDFTYNIEEPLSTVNYALQGNKDGLFKSFWRFVINTTLGVGGMFDIAAKFGVTSEQQSLGNTLAHYGVGPGPYIILPVFGGYSMRNVTETLGANRFMNPLKIYLHESFRHPVTATRLVHDRDKIMPFTDYVTANSVDPYVTIRDAILQQTESKMDYPEGFRCPSVGQ